MNDSLSKGEQIHFKKDVSGFKQFNDYLIYFEEKLNLFIDFEKDRKNFLCSNELNRLKTKIEKEIVYTNKRRMMLE